MNFAHIHLIINHIPLLTIPITIIFLTYALFCNDDGLKRFSLVILIATSVTVLPTYLTGEPAEKAVKHLPGVTEDVIEPHEEAAELSMIVTLIAGTLAAASLVFANHTKLKHLLPKITVAICIVAVGALGYTANLGGKIRHPESSDAAFAKSKQALDSHNETHANDEDIETGDKNND